MKIIGCLSNKVSLSLLALTDAAPSVRSTPLINRVVAEEVVVEVAADREDKDEAVTLAEVGEEADGAMKMMKGST